LGNKELIRMNGLLKRESGEIPICLQHDYLSSC
jgi:hypothetical protein